MTFYKPWPAGVATGERVGAKHLNILDAQLSGALDATYGGIYPGMLVCADRASFDQGVYFQPSGISGSFTKFVMPDYPATSGTWTKTAYGSYIASATGGDVTFHFRIPTGAVLRSFGVYILPNDPHSSSSFDPPEIHLSVEDRHALSAPTGYAASRTDSNADLVAYEAIHAIENTSNSSETGWQAHWSGKIRFVNEDNGDALSGLKLLGAFVRFDPAYLDPFRCAG